MHLLQLGLRQPAECLADVRGMAGEDLANQRATRIGQIQPIGPAVFRVRAPLDPSGRTDAVDEPADVPLRDEEPLRQLLLGDALAMQQRRQDVELRQRQPMGCRGA